MLPACPQLSSRISVTYSVNPSTGHILSEFARQRVLPYLEDDHPEVRQSAALTCCRLYARDPICHQASAHAIEVMSEVLDKLLVVGIADPGMPCVVSILAGSNWFAHEMPTFAKLCSQTSRSVLIDIWHRRKMFALSSSL